MNNSISATDRVNITEAMDMILDDISDEISQLCFREDAEEYLDSMEYAVNQAAALGKTSKIAQLWSSVYRELEEMGVAFEKKKNFAYLRRQLSQSDLPGRGDIEALKARILRTLLTQYTLFPDPASFMNRLVNQLESSADNWKEDSLRLRILKQFIKYGGYLYDAGYRSRAYILKYLGLNPGFKNTDTVLRLLDESIFTAAEEEIARVTREVGEITADMKKSLPGLYAERDLLNTNAAPIREKCKANEADAAKNAKQLKKVQKKRDDLSDKLLGLTDSLENAALQIEETKTKLLHARNAAARAQTPENERNVIKYTDLLQRRETALRELEDKAETLRASLRAMDSELAEIRVRLKILADEHTALTEELRPAEALLENKKKEIARLQQQIDTQEDKIQVLKTPEGKLGLICLANDLAGGKFRTGGKTKNGLYLFAMVYGMRFGTGNTLIRGRADLDSPFYDIEKNLFRDYYCNNLIRCFSSDEYRENAGAFEDQPTGQGINYKNYTEAVYLYYLNKEGLTPVERIEKSAGVLEILKKQSPSSASSVSVRESESTVVFRKRFIDQVLGLKEEELIPFITAHYTLDRFDRKMVNGNMKVQPNMLNTILISTEQNSAWEQYSLLCRAMQTYEESYDSVNPDNDPGSRKKKKVQSAQNTITKKQKRELKKYSAGLAFAEAPDFPDYVRTTVMAGMKPEVSPQTADDFCSLLRNFNRYVRRDFLTVSSPRDMTRTALLSVFHGYITINPCLDVLETSDEEFPGFREFFDSYARQANPYLENACYQPLSTKNIFDVLLVLAAYFNIYYDTFVIDDEDSQ